MNAQAETNAQQWVQKHYRLRFHSPAFLGNAWQQGQWRSPPFKHLLREWWRVAWSAEHRFADDVAALRAAETRLFGGAHSDEQHVKSRVRLRLDAWRPGSLKAWSKGAGGVEHKEVGRRVGADLYLGFGPLIYDRQSKQTTLGHAPAIDAAEEARFSLAFPADAQPLMEQTLALMSRYAAVGGRSRNGWGAFQLYAQDQPLPAPQPVLRDWRQCLDRDWPHALGKDEQGALIWRSKDAFSHWRKAINKLAEIKIALRTRFPFRAGNTRQPEPRHWLSYPTTNHKVFDWSKNARLPNSLRFKILDNGQGGLHLLLYHLPCLPPKEFTPQRNAIEQVWSQVHAFLDQHPDLDRSKR